MLQVTVSFPSASGEILQLPKHSKVGDLKILAQKTFGKGLLKLVTEDGRLLTNPQDSLQAAGVKDAAHLTAVVQQVQLAASCNAFAAWCRGGSRILTWGDQIFGGDCSAVQERLQNVQRVPRHI